MSSSASASTAIIEDSYISDYDAILTVMERYTEGVRTGNSAVMKPSFHENATFYGYSEGTLLAGPIQILFDWIDANGPASATRVRFANVDIVESIAVVRVEMENMGGKLAGEPGAKVSDLFQLIRIDGKWMISQKSFHWHSR